MVISLTHVQRLNLHALLGSLRGLSVSAARAVWRLQDSIDLDKEEASAINLRRELVEGQEVSTWDPKASVNKMDFVFSDSDWALLQSALSQCSSFRSQDREWLEPLLEREESK